jgi:hypothetical protein
VARRSGPPGVGSKDGVSSLRPIHAEVLTAEGLGAARKHAGASDALGFYLAGGTALALQLGHRTSVDFDWFRNGEMFEPLEVAAELRGGGVPLHVVSTSQGTIHGEVEGIRVSWIAYRYPLLEPTLRWDALGCSMASPIDIAAMKLAAVAQRGARKDFYDIAALQRSGVDLRSMIEAYRRRYGVEDIAHVLRALVWFADAERDHAVAGSSMSWEQVRREVEAAVRRLAQ